MVARYLNLDRFHRLAADVGFGLSQFVEGADFLELVAVCTDQQVSLGDVILRVTCNDFDGVQKELVFPSKAYSG